MAVKLTDLDIEGTNFEGRYMIKRLQITLIGDAVAAAIRRQANAKDRR